MTLEELKEGKIFLVDKPLDWTSFDVVNKIRWKIKQQYKIKKIKVGHAGTLDPKATGLLILCIGNETKNAEKYQTESKVYTGRLKLGASTPSYDLETEENEFFPINQITNEMIHACAESFIGTQIQYPPIFSAIKKDGKRLYELARKGIDTEIKGREIKIFSMKITQIEMPFVDFEVTCSKGTYIRSLAFDFGKKLQSGSYLVALRREKSGDFEVNNAYTVENLLQLIENEKY